MLHTLCIEYYFLDNFSFFLIGLKPQNFGFTFLTFVILFNNLIPISLPVTLEVRRIYLILVLSISRRFLTYFAPTSMGFANSDFNYQLMKGSQFYNIKVVLGFSLLGKT